MGRRLLFRARRCCCHRRHATGHFRLSCKPPSPRPSNRQGPALANRSHDQANLSTEAALVVYQTIKKGGFMRSLVQSAPGVHKGGRGFNAKVEATGTAKACPPPPEDCPRKLAKRASLSHRR